MIRDDLGRVIRMQVFAATLDPASICTASQIFGDRHPLTETSQKAGGQTTVSYARRD